MNQGLIEAWNSVVKKDDEVFHLGDFCFKGYDKWVEIIKQLNGQITIIKGNHDKQVSSKNFMKTDI
jgi:calcineurin-like phosphoesterase family protein